jgi:hypothetical protein
MKENLNLFFETAKLNKEEAKRIFFGGNFKEYYLQNEPKLRWEYDQLLEGREQNQILDEFLVCAGVKEPARLEQDAEEKVISVDFHELGARRRTEENPIWKKAEALYLEFRCGRLYIDEFCEKAYHLISSEYGMLADLFRFQLALLSGRSEEAENRMAQLMEEKPWEEGGFTESYYYYLKALYEKNPLTNEKSLLVIRENEKEDYKYWQYYVWISFYLDESIAFSMKKQMELLHEVAEDQELLPILKYEAVSIWNRNPLIMKEMDDFMIEQLNFGWEYGVVSKEVCSQYARLVRRMPEFREDAFALLEKIYMEYSEEEYLQSICRTIVRTGQWKKKYHTYLKEAVRMSLKINGLFEAYIRTIDQSEFEPMEPAVLHYFSYSNSLSEDETAYLYANIVKNQDIYGITVQNYHVRIELFVIEAMKKGYMSDIYASLYQQYLPLLIKEKSAIQALPNIIFKHKLSCDQLTMESVVISHFEKHQSDRYELKEGVAYCDIYSDCYIATFYDSVGNPYIASVTWEIEPIFPLENADGTDPEEYVRKCYELCMSQNITHEKMMVKEAAKFRQKEALEKENVPYIQQLLDSQVLTNEVKEILLELLLDYYYKNHEYRKLEEYLRRVRWENVQEKNQITMIEYFLSQELYGEAVKGMERYGFESIQPKLLRKAAFYLLEQLDGMKSLFLTHMCEILFLNGNEDREILLYLQQHIPEDANYGVSLWRQGRQLGLYDADYTCYLILKLVEEEALSEDLEVIFLEYVKREQDTEALSHMVLEEFGKWYFFHGQSFLPEFLEYLTGFLAIHGWKDVHYPLAWLHSMSGKKEFRATERELIEKIINDLTEHEIYLSFLLNFETVMLLPRKLYCISFVTYKGKAGKQVSMHCQTEQDGVIWQMPMTEILDGIYIGYFAPFVDEDPDVYVTIAGEQKKYRNEITIEPGALKGKGLKYHKINEMLSMMHHDKVYDVMNQFEETQYLIEQSLKPWF